LRKVTNALTTTAQMYSSAIAQRQQRSVNSVFMESMAMLIDGMPAEIQSYVRAQVMAVVTQAQTGCESNRPTYHTLD
jgi:hypothetical protein